VEIVEGAMMGWTPNDASEEAEKNGHAKHRFKLVRWRDIELGNAPRYLVQNLIPREGLIIVWGPPKCGKTFWVFDLMMHVALGWEYRDHRVELGSVVYIACEGERGLAARKEAFRLAKLPEDADPPFYLLTTRLDLTAQVDELILDITAQIPGATCSAIVLDTLNRSIGGSESDDEDMGAYVKAADKLREKFHCAVIIIHHCGTNDKRPRGHTSLTGAADAQIAVARNGGGEVLTKVEFMKDGEEGDETTSRLQVVEIGHDENDELITSCVVEETSGAIRKEGTKKHPPPPSQKRALELLREAINRAGKIPAACNHIPSNTPCIPEALWRDYCYSGQITKSDKSDAKRQAFNRAAEALVAAGYVGTWNDQVWLI
jgi:hypothetical protein